jgi:hypothetical protein
VVMAENNSEEKVYIYAYARDFTCQCLTTADEWARWGTVEGRELQRSSDGNIMTIGAVFRASSLDGARKWLKEHHFRLGYWGTGATE